jgi:MarR family 2-MHQ and catechol resistance regulon transcriptional repressor
MPNKQLTSQQSATKQTGMQRKVAFDLIYQTVRTANTLLRESRRLFRPFGLSEAQFNVLNVLSENEQGLSQRELSDILVVDRSNVTGLLDRMEKSGWVRRHDVPNDRRSYRIRLTAPGRKLWASIYPTYEKAVIAAARRVGAESVKNGVEMLRRLEVEAQAIGSELEGEK